MAKKKQIGICKLCLQTKELCNSHIIPEFAYKDVYVYHSANNRRLQTLKFEKGAKPELTHYQKGIREHLLCQDCELKFSVWEKYVIENLRTLTQGYSEKFIYVRVDYNKFRLFQLSILWRCLICLYPDYYYDIGSHTETLRQMLHNNETGKNYLYPCIMTFLYINNEIRTDLIMTYESWQIDRLRVCQIIFSGVIWTFFVGNKSDRVANRMFESAYLQPSGRLTIMPAQMSDVEFLRKGFEKTRC